MTINLETRIVSGIANGSQRQSIAVDTLLENVFLRAAQVHSKSFSPPWGLLGRKLPLMFYAVTRGHALMEYEGGKGCRELIAGDLVLVKQDVEHRLFDERSSPLSPVEELQAPSSNRQSRKTVEKTPDTETIGLVFGNLYFDEQVYSPKMDAMPPVIHIRESNFGSAAWLQSLIAQIARESTSLESGSQIVTRWLAQLLLTYAIRAYVNQRPVDSEQWFVLLRDADIGLAVGLMQAKPEAPWTVASLAHQVCMSRSAFAGRFTAVMHDTPMRYLLQCRLRKACSLLDNSRIGLKEIAARVGYSSEAAFSCAFKRWAGIAPSSYRQRDQVPATH